MYEDYKIISEKSTAAVTKAVVKAMEEFWEPVGGICFDGANYHQAIALPAEEEEE